MKADLPPATNELPRVQSGSATDERPALRPPQFRLATLFWIVTGCGVLFAAMAMVGPIGAFALMMLVLAIIAHVAGGAIGTQLREIGSAKDFSDTTSLRPRQRVEQHEFAPETQLCRRTSVSRMMIALTIVSAVLSGVAGSGVLFWLTWRQINVPTAIVAIGSSIVLGALLGFMCSSFALTAGGAWWQARHGVK